MTVTRIDAVAEARAWLGTPFQHQGCLKGVACDCIGLIKGVGMALGLVDYDPHSSEARAFASYSMTPNSKRMREGLATWLVPIPVPEAKLADILFMAWTREPQHVALVTEPALLRACASDRQSRRRWQSDADMVSPSTLAWRVAGQYRRAAV